MTFVRQKSGVLIGECDGKAVGFALFFRNSSPFLGRAGMYPEDLWVMPELRGCGFGTAFLARLAAISVEWQCGWSGWWCLDWNRAGLGFYLLLGGVPMGDGTV